MLGVTTPGAKMEAESALWAVDLHRPLARANGWIRMRHRDPDPVVREAEHRAALRRALRYGQTDRALAALWHLHLADVLAFAKDRRVAPLDRPDFAYRFFHHSSRLLPNYDGKQPRAWVLRSAAYVTFRWYRSERGRVLAWTPRTRLPTTVPDGGLADRGPSSGLSPDCPVVELPAGDYARWPRHAQAHLRRCAACRDVVELETVFAGMPANPPTVQWLYRRFGFASIALESLQGSMEAFPSVWLRGRPVLCLRRTPGGVHGWDPRARVLQVFVRQGDGPIVRVAAVEREAAGVNVFARVAVDEPTRVLAFSAWDNEAVDPAPGSPSPRRCFWATTGSGRRAGPRG